MKNGFQMYACMFEINVYGFILMHLASNNIEFDTPFPFWLRFSYRLAHMYTSTYMACRITLYKIIRKKKNKTTTIMVKPTT